MALGTRGSEQTITYWGSCNIRHESWPIVLNSAINCQLRSQDWNCNCHVLGAAAQCGHFHV